jgi:uncharacterized membrane protein
MQKTVFATQPQTSSSLNWRSAIADIILAGMVVGPLAAPFLSSSGLPLLPAIAGIIHAMGMHVCPQPHMGLALVPPFTMAVCMRCYGTVLGLLITRLLYANSSTGFYWLMQYGLLGATLTSLLMMAYPVELAAQVLGLWSFNNYVVTLFGLITGVGMGLFFLPILHNQGVKAITD